MLNDCCCFFFYIIYLCVGGKLFFSLPLKAFPPPLQHGTLEMYLFPVSCVQTFIFTLIKCSECVRA